MSTAKRSKPGVLLAKLAVSMTLTVLLLAAIEFAAGFFVLSREAVSSSRADTSDTVSVTLAWLWSNPVPLREDPDFLWHNQPRAKRTQPVNPRALDSTAEWTIENNSLGFRGPEVRRDRSAKNAYRVLCIGDSVTFGFNGDQADTYPAQLAEFLRAKQPGKDIEVINAGVPGWTWLQGVRFLERQGLALEPDLVIMAHGVNDQIMPALLTDAERLERADDPRVMWAAKLRGWLGETNLYRFIEQQFAAPPPPAEPSPGCQQQIDAHGSCRRVSPEQIEVAVARAGALTQSSGVDLLILNLDFLKTPAAQAARTAAQEAEITFVDLVRQMDFVRAGVEQLRIDELGLRPARDRPSQPLERPLMRHRRVTFRVQAPAGGGSYHARGRVPFLGDYEFQILLNDEGLGGDEKPGDGVFGGTLTLPPGISTLIFMFYRGEDREFRPLPPMHSGFGDRNLLIDDQLTTPVYRFAERFLMAERTHPNADGYAMIAETVAFEIGKLPSFHR